MSATTDVIDAQIEAYRARDVEKFLSHHADDASVVMFDGTMMFPSKGSCGRRGASRSRTARTCR
jgi:hypothetical protein